MDNNIPKFITKLSDPKEIRTVMENSKTKNRKDVYQAAFIRLCEVEGMSYEDPLHRDFYQVLAAYEQLLTEKNGKTTKASRTRQKLKRHGIEKCLEDWATSTSPTQGFELLVAANMRELTGEYIILKYPERFSDEAVQAAEKRLGQLK